MKPLLLSVVVATFLCVPVCADTFPTPAQGILPRLEIPIDRDGKRTLARQKLAQERVRHVEELVRRALAWAQHDQVKARNARVRRGSTETKTQHARKKAKLF